MSAMNIELYEEAYNLPKMTNRERIKLGDTLLNALEAASLSYKMIPSAQAELIELRDLEPDPVKRRGRDYQIWLVAQQLNRASELAAKRFDYLTNIKTSVQVDAELAKCKADKAHWFEYYAWGFDPRPDSPLNTIPFSLFEFQERFVDWLDYIVFKTRQSGVVPKSRDMGATEAALRWSVHNWLFKESFEVLLLSRTEDEVDSKNDVNTLFEKVRFQLRLLPVWMIPEKFNLDRDMPYMLIKNPANASTFHGRAPTENVGRQGRATCVFYDESAFAGNGGYKQHTSLSQTTKSIIDISSVGGRQNKFADLMLDGRTPQFVMDWREHPWKSEDWYNALPTGVFGSAMTTQQIAQEVDRDLDASQPGKVWKFREEYLFLTWKEVAEAFAGFGFRDRFFDSRGNYQIPRDWNWSRFHDYGQTPGHEWGYAVAARPTQFYPLNDTVFVFLALELKPTGLTTEQAVRLWKDYEQDLGLRDDLYRFYREPIDSLHSHEQKSLRETLITEYGENWQAWTTDYISGIEQMQSWMNVIEDNRPNPFRSDLFGRTKIVFVAPDDEYQLAFDQRNGAYFVTNSKTELGYLTARKQLSAYHYPEEERGKDVKKMRPAKQFDDIIDPLRALAVHWGVPSKERTHGEEVETRLASDLKQMEVARHYGKDGYAELMMARLQEQRHIEAQMAEEKRREAEKLQQAFGSGTRVRILGRRR